MVERKKKAIYGSAIALVVLLAGFLTLNSSFQGQIENPSYMITVEGELEKSNAVLDPQPLSKLYIVDAAEGCKDGEKLGTVESGLQDGSKINISYTAKERDVQDQQPGVDLNPLSIRFCANTETGTERYESITTYSWQELENATYDGTGYEGTIGLKTPERDGTIKWEIDLTKFSMRRAVA